MGAPFSSASLDMAMVEAETAPSLIFVVEDHEMLRMEAVDLLQDAGFRTLDAADADSALAVMRQRWQDVRVLFTDVQMPGEIDGVGLIQEVHRCWPDVLLLVTSGEVRLRDEDLPDDGRFVPKPYRASTLNSQVRQLIERGHGQ